MKLFLIPGLILGLFVGGCGGSEPYDYIGHGYYVRFHGEEDHDFEYAFQRCQKALGIDMTSKYNTSTWFTDQPLDSYEKGKAIPAAGIYSPSDHWTSIEQAPCLEDTALCHEMLHVHFAERDMGWGSADNNHTDPLWQKLPPVTCVP